jgi:aminoglycoside phosphotransferase (APT) family kinase protein
VPVPPLFDKPELVSHQDYCPGNIVFRDGLPVALIDFDLAKPTTRVVDCVNALYWWAPLLDPVDRAPALRDADVAQRVRLFADAYGMNQSQRLQVVPIAAQRARNSHLTMRAAAQVDLVFKRWWDEGVRDRMPRAEQWIATESERIRDALLA